MNEQMVTWRCEHWLTELWQRDRQATARGEPVAREDYFREMAADFRQYCGDLPPDRLQAVAREWLEGQRRMFDGRPEQLAILDLFEQFFNQLELTPA